MILTDEVYTSGGGYITNGGGELGEVLSFCQGYPPGC